MKFFTNLVSESNSPWCSENAYSISRDSLYRLFINEIPAVIIPQAICANSCRNIIENIHRKGLGSYSHINHHVGRLGLTQMEYYLNDNKGEYFSKVKECQENLESILAGSSVDPIRYLMNVISELTGLKAGTAFESEALGPYFAGTFRNVTTVGHLHFDFAKVETTGWKISDVCRQLTWNLYLNETDGGDLLVYNKRYTPEDELLRVPGDYWYNHKAVEGASVFRYRPRAGDIVIFDSTNFHEIEPVVGNRFTLSSFIGLLNEQELIFWS